MLSFCRKESDNNTRFASKKKNYLKEFFLAVNHLSTKWLATANLNINVENKYIHSVLKIMISNFVLKPQKRRKHYKESNAMFIFKIFLLVKHCSQCRNRLKFCSCKLICEECRVKGEVRWVSFINWKWKHNTRYLFANCYCFNYFILKMSTSINPITLTARKLKSRFN